MTHMCVLGLTEDLEARVLKRKLRASHRERRRVPLKTGDGACRYSGGGAVERIGPMENPRRFHYLEQGDLQEKCSSFNNM